MFPTIKVRTRHDSNHKVTPEPSILATHKYFSDCRFAWGHWVNGRLPGPLGQRSVPSFRRPRPDCQILTTPHYRRGRNEAHRSHCPTPKASSHQAPTGDITKSCSSFPAPLRQFEQVNHGSCGAGWPWVKDVPWGRMAVGQGCAVGQNGRGLRSRLRRVLK